ncbi:la-related protein 6-like [Eublepharis macularius]|uniref:La-related protein 6-like n=1 Tax=Eublepharis macularius TaxID=481883 RepID=A0AA97K6Z8_EUBMA|nr:la-related protein 6-like [Eublepharis macularius]
MSSCNPAMTGFDSQLKCSAPVPIQGSPFSALQFLPRSSRSFPLLSQEEFVDTLDGDFLLLPNRSPGLLESGISSMPDLQLVKRIVSQVEFYLSDENLSKDAFLLKHVQKNKMGFVSIKLLTSFKKVKYLTRDWRVTLYALQFSEALEVNEEGTKVRRRNPIPEFLVNIPPSKMLLAWNVLPQEQAISTSLLFQTIFLIKITKLFSPFGDITSIRIFRPGKKLPSDLKKYVSRYPELLTKCCALVEYESLESARKAFEELCHKQVVGHGEAIKVVSLSGRGSKKKGMVNQEDSEETEEVEKPPGKWANVLSEGLQHALEDSSFYSSSESDSTPVLTPILPRNFLSAPVWPTKVLSSSTSLVLRPNFFSMPYIGPLPLHESLAKPLFSLPLSAPELGHSASELQRPSDSCWHSGMGSGILWASKQKGQACNQPIQGKPQLLNSMAPTKRMLGSLGARLAVIRLPHGPDGTKGFYNTIGRGKFVLQL